MNVTKITAAVALSLVAIASHADEDERDPWKPQTISQMSATTYKVVSMLARCSVAYDRESTATKNTDWRQFTAKTSKYSFELLEMFAGDAQEVQALIRSNQQQITDKTLPGIIAECNGMFLDSSKNKI